MSSAAAATHAHTWRVQTTAAQRGDWRTPAAIYEPLDREFRFTLDAAASAGNAKHVRYLERDVDALGLSWAAERVFCNPPYGRGLGAWVRKAYLEAIEHEALVVMLLPARTDTIWFHTYVLPHAEVRFIRGRLSYQLTAALPSKRGRSPFASCVVIFRPGKKFEGATREQLLFPFLPRVP